MQFNEKVKFPIQWHYKIITNGSLETLKKIENLLKNLLITETPQKSNTSKHGNYTSYTLSIMFQNKEDMEKVSDSLEKVEGIKFLL